MKKFAMCMMIFTIAAITANTCFSQSGEVNQLDDMGRKQGAWQAKFPNGKTKYEGQFHDDKPFGEFKYYYVSGALKAINSFGSNSLIAYNKSYFENGILMAEGKYIDQKKDSIWRFYSDVDSVLLSEESYSADLRDGMVKNYYPGTEQLSELIHYVKGIKEGEWVKYFEDGTVLLRGTYLHDVLVGEIIFNYPDGKLNIKGQYVNGYKDGKWLVYNADGSLDHEEFYDMGALR